MYREKIQTHIHVERVVMICTETHLYRYTIITNIITSYAGTMIYSYMHREKIQTYVHVECIIIIYFWHHMREYKFIKYIIMGIQVDMLAVEI